MQHPPWRQMAEETLKHKAPKRYRELKRSRQLQTYLDDVERRATASYEKLVQEIEASGPDRESFALMSAQEIVQRDVLDPTM